MFEILNGNDTPIEMEYKGKSSPIELEDGRVIQNIDQEVFADYVESQYPYLKGQNWHVGRIETV